MSTSDANAEGVPMAQVHRYFSAHCFNACWELIDKPDRTEQENEDMVLLATASLWHWTRREDCKPVNISIGYWQVARVNALAGRPEAARTYAEKCVALSESKELPAFYVGYAYEALARAELEAGHPHKAAPLLTRARTFLVDVPDEEERQRLADDIGELQKRCVALDKAD